MIYRLVVNGEEGGWISAASDDKVDDDDDFLGTDLRRRDCGRCCCCRCEFDSSWEEIEDVKEEDDSCDCGGFTVR